jgi:hypothetical protein
MSYSYYMRKKTSVGKSKRNPQVKQVHYIVIVLSVVVVAVLVTWTVLPIKNSGVLGAHVLARGGPGSSGEHPGGDHPGDIRRTESDAVTHTEIEFHKNGGQDIKQGSGSGKQNRGPASKQVADLLKKFLGKTQDRGDHKASESGIIVASESGERVHLKKDPKEKILVLPEKAVAALLKNGIIQEIASGSGAASSSGQPLVIYTVTNGKPVYIVAGTKEEKLFGAIPVRVDKTVTLSAETGSIVSTKQSLVNRILDLLSF